MNDSTTRATLQFADAVCIAKCCADYGGGYRQDAALYEAYKDGIATVINALQSAERIGLDDSQVRALHGIGGNQEKLRSAAPLLLEALQELVKDAVAAQWNMRAAAKADPRWDGCAEVFQPRIDAARAAIAAATN